MPVLKRSSSGGLAVGIVGIHQQHIQCIIGINPQERLQKQSIYINLKVKVDLEKCFLSENMNDTVDYVVLAEICNRSAEKNFFLLETLGSDILERCFEKLPIIWGWIQIQKPLAIETAAYGYIELESYR